MTTWQVGRMGLTQTIRLKREQGRQWAKIRWDRERKERLINPPDVDADTLRDRAFYDRKGKPAALNVSFYYSTRRRDQYDVFMDGKLIFTGAPRKIAEQFHILLANFASKHTVAP